MKLLNQSFKRYILLISVMGLFGCGGGGGDDDEIDPPAPTVKTYSLNQAVFSGGQYRYGALNAQPNPGIIKAPADTDFDRWAKLHDGGNYRLYFFKKGSNTTIYQFAWNSSMQSYEYGYNGAIPELSIVGAPAEADPSSFAMLHDGSNYRLYMKGKTNKTRLYQFAFRPSTQRYEYGYNSIAQINITGSPTDTDQNRWAMLHDGSSFRYYAFKQGSKTNFYQFAFNGSTYAYGHNSIANLTVSGMPAETDTSSFAMNHDGVRYRFYFRQIDEE